MCFNLSNRMTKAAAIFVLLLLFTLSSISEEDSERELTITLGDTREAVLGKWGEPAQKDRQYKVGDRREVWVYTCEYLTPCPRDCDWYYELPCYYLFFVNGELNAWEEVR